MSYLQCICCHNNSYLKQLIALVLVAQRLLAVYLSTHVIIQSQQHGNDRVLHEVSTVHSYLLR